MGKKLYKVTHNWVNQNGETSTDTAYVAADNAAEACGIECNGQPVEVIELVKLDDQIVKA